ncbi:glycosyltransferase family 4 protein [Pedobacter jejuensis]|uniref:Glycosyltransferase family 1 protein n=1 Tax=Pedobacter jejuensis TaxID=1268550 RepID=A0A3N0BQ11_9SPHI|nr:glycosyltransferase family 4 protein [Pedobacter jejuensis]RNL51137.1 glycosyltransferase family 1 protein [Pedobacter jejuensis]
MKKLVIITTHPIQYYAPLFKLLAKECNLIVYYTLGLGNEKYDKGFEQNIEWDVDLLEGYNYRFLKNSAKNPSLNHFMGIKNHNLIKKINECSPDAILIYGWAYYSHLNIMRHFKNKIPIWFRGDSTLTDNQSWFKKELRKAFLKWVYSKVDLAFYVGKANKQYFKSFGLNDEKLIYLPHAIDNNRFSQDKKAEAEAIRNKYNVAKSDILVLFAGKFEKKKSPDLLLDAFMSLQEPNAHLLFVGNGPMEKQLKEKAHQHSLNNPSFKIYFMDFQNQSNMPAIYHTCDLFCLPSQGPGETWGLAVNEAMACGKAILVSDKVGCARDLINNKINGEIFESKHFADLSKKLNSLVSNKNELNKMGAESAQIIKNYTFDIQVEQLITVLNA